MAIKTEVLMVVEKFGFLTWVGGKTHIPSLRNMINLPANLKAADDSCKACFLLPDPKAWDRKILCSACIDFGHGIVNAPFRFRLREE
jgi:hypothetical protein